MIKITSDDLIPINENFRVVAGPGAGKTHWLINHICHILKDSKKLCSTKKVVCITYTNVGVDIIRKRLGDCSSVEVMTIHGFLYSNVLKPYATFLDKRYGVDAIRIDGHEEPLIHRKQAKQWLENHPKNNRLRNPFTVNQLTRLPQNLMALCNWLISMKAVLDEEGNIKFECDNRKAVYYTYVDGNQDRIVINYVTLNTLKNELLSYKKLLWDRGIIDHEDVLFLCYILIKENPFILNVIRSKYPYIFVDEYQDTSPIQTQILEFLANVDVTMGVIGDEAQSIYSFQGADVGLFRRDITSQTKEYLIEGNRRSTQMIIDSLNAIRTNISQRCIRETPGTKPYILIGEKKKALEKASEILATDNIQSLARDNITSNVLKREDDVFDYDKNIVDRIYSVDSPSTSNKYRSLNILRCIQSVELARENKYKEAISTMKKILKKGSNSEYLNRDAVVAVKLLIDKYEQYRYGKLIDFIGIVKKDICKDIPNLRAGKPKALYEDIDYKQVAICMNITEDISFSKTIHKAKGEEFESVLLVLKKENDIDFLLEPDLENNEEHRVNYVAMSRAKDNLLINVPKMTKKKRAILEAQFEILTV